jgi:hypothetical protein
VTRVPIATSLIGVRRVDFGIGHIWRRACAVASGAGGDRDRDHQQRSILATEKVIVMPHFTRKERTSFGAKRQHGIYARCARRRFETSGDGNEE